MLWVFKLPLNQPLVILFVPLRYSESCWLLQGPAAPLEWLQTHHSSLKTPQLLVRESSSSEVCSFTNCIATNVTQTSWNIRELRFHQISSPLQIRWSCQHKHLRSPTGCLRTKPYAMLSGDIRSAFNWEPALAAVAHAALSRALPDAEL